MSLDAEILGVLQGNAGVLALVPAARIYGGRAKDNPTDADYPHIVVSQVSGTPEAVTTTGRLMMEAARYQVEPFARTRASAKAISRAVIVALQAYRSVDRDPIQDVQFELQSELYDDALSAWSVATDFIVLFEG